MNVILGVRPEDLTIGLTPSPDSLAASVYVIEQMGREILLTTKVGATLVKAFASPSIDLEMGQNVYLAFPEEAIRVFDGETEMSLLDNSPAAGEAEAHS